MVEPVHGAPPDRPGADSTSERWRDAVQKGAEYAGAITGGAVGLVEGPAGAFAGAVAGVAVGQTLQRVGLEVCERVTLRQQSRVAAALAFAARDTEANAAAGMTPRTDGFFDSRADARSDADELLEGVLLRAADAYEERKVRHLAAILPSVAVRDDVTIADAHWLTRTADRLSWRQLVVLARFIDPPETELATADVDQEERGLRPTPPALIEEVDELGQLGLLGVVDSSENVVRAGSTYGSSPTIWGAPKASWRLTQSGRQLAEVAHLADVGEGEMARITTELIG